MPRRQASLLREYARRIVLVMRSNLAGSRTGQHRERGGGDMSTPKDVLKAERLARIEPHQFKKGESPNPGGRPKGAVSIKKLLTDAIHKVDPKDADGRTHAEKLVQALIDVATRPQGQASIKAIAEIFDRLEGKALQAITVSPLD